MALSKTRPTSSLFSARIGDQKDIAFFLMNLVEQAPGDFRCHLRIGERRDSILSCLKKPACRLNLGFKVGPIGSAIEATVQRISDLREGWLTFEIVEAVIHAFRGQIFSIPLTMDAHVAQVREFASEDGTMWI